MTGAHRLAGRLRFGTRPRRNHRLAAPMTASIPGGEDPELDTLAALLRDRRLLVLTGAGASTDCGIPDYRGADGAWKRRQPVHYQTFVGNIGARRRYWARSLIGWPRIAGATPGPAHHALARLEHAGRLHCLITQNVDGLHGRAGSRALIDLHGCLDRLECLDCGRWLNRHRFQEDLLRLNPGWQDLGVEFAPDGDADLEDLDFTAFEVPDCPDCGGMLKPAVTFFGENVPRPRVAEAFARLEEAEALLVIGSSLMVLSGYRFVRAAHAAGKPVAAINLGRTRGDAEFVLKLERPCGEALAELVRRLLV